MNKLYLVALFIVIPLSFSVAKASDAVAEAYLDHATRAIRARNYDNAIRLLEQAADHVDHQVEEHGDHPVYGDKLYVSTIYNNLGECYRKIAVSQVGSLKSTLLVNAQKRLRKAIELKEAVLGNDSIQVTKVMENLASAYAANQQLLEAEALYRRALAIREHHEGKGSINTFYDLLQLGDLFARSKDGNRADAERYYGRALSVAKNCYSANDPLVAKCHQQLAHLYYLHDKLDQAALHYDSAVRIYALNGEKSRANLRQCKEELQPLLWDLFAIERNKLFERLDSSTDIGVEHAPFYRSMLATARRLELTADVEFLTQLLRLLTTKRFPKFAP